MPNAFLTAKEIARTALPLLQNNLVAPALFHKDYSADFAKKGDTIQVKRPTVFVAEEFSTTINIQALSEKPVYVTMDKIADISVEVTSKEMALSIEDFTEQVIKPAIIAIAEKINADGLDLYKYVPYRTGVAGTTPSTITAFTGARKSLNKNKVPLSPRKAIFDTEAEAKLLELDTLNEVDKAGTNVALREAVIGRVMGIDTFMSQAVKTHTAGGYTSLADVKASITATNNADDATTGFTYSSAVLTSTAGAATTALKKGDLLTIDGKQKVVIEDTANAVSGVVTAKVYPAETADVSAKAVVFADVTSRAHTANLAFHPMAFAYVTRPLERPVGYTDAQAYVTSFEGITLRIVFGYNMSTKKQMLSIDTLYGYAPLYPELATQILG